MSGFDFYKPQHTKQLWETILPHWAHRDRPAGQRFLGSFYIKQKVTDEVLDCVGSNLGRFSKITSHFLYERFDEPEQNWIKILTFAFSEYAYHYSNPESKFWDGLCKKLHLRSSQGVEEAFRQIVREGIDLLGLVKAKGGYSYVSTLWLQSGIPKQNLSHFAELVSDFADEYGWWEIAHTNSEDISQAILDFCQEKYPQRGTLLHFLKSSCSEGDEEVEPISGQLVQGIALVAYELERGGESPEILKDENRREELLGRYYLPQNFFLRIWDSLIQVLTPKERQRRTSRTIISQRQKPLSLVLDVADSLNIQLLLPEQRLWKTKWSNLRGTFCKIPEAGWEDCFPTSSKLLIPEQVIDVRSISERWKWYLLDSRGSSLVEWNVEGVASDFPCLIFDAWSGDRLLPNPNITGAEEIICFTPKDAQIDFSSDIEVLDSWVPCSISEWRGQQVRLTDEEGVIDFTFPSGKVFRNWKKLASQQPILRGLRLKGKKPVYLESPTFWHPPCDRENSLNISLENITTKSPLVNTTETLLADKSWREIPLRQWITEPGSYEARFGNQFYRRSFRFEVQFPYRLTEKPNLPKLRITSRQGYRETWPLKFTDTNKFWAEEITIEGLWPLEEVTFLLSDGRETVPYPGQADRSGNLTVSLAALYDLLSESDWYSLDYQRLGEEQQRLMEIETRSPSFTWTNQAIHLSSLQVNCRYSLCCWNLLLPQSKSMELDVPLVEQEEDAVTVPLELPPGIYHIQLLLGRSPHNLGWWCRSDQYDLPNEALEDDALENYCYTILGDEPVSDFLKAVKHLNPDCNTKWLETVTFSLQKADLCHFPNWLKRDFLLEKMQAWRQAINSKSEFSVAQAASPKVNPEPKQSRSQEPGVSGKGSWYFVTLSNPHQRESYCKQLQELIKREKLQNFIFRVEKPGSPDYRNLVLLKVSNFKAVRDRIQSLEYGRIERKPLSDKEVKQMLRG